MSCYFNPAEMKSLLDIRDKIQKRDTLQSIASAGNFKDNFPLLYAAILLASHGRKEDAFSIYNSGKLKHPFAEEFFRFLKKTSSVEPKVVVFNSSLPYDAWVKTNLFKTELDGTLRTIGNFYRDAKFRQPVSILDIGPGNGKMTAMVINHLIELKGIKSIKLVLVDKFTSMLNSASEFCQKNINAKVEIETICCPAQCLEESQIKILQKYAPFALTICSRSIHHMTSDLKEVLLKELSSITESLILIEMNSTHDLPEKDDPDLIYSVVKSYGFIFDDIRKSLLTEEEMIASIDDFLLAEALFIMGKERAERIDYHATESEWRALAQNAGFKVPMVEPSAVYPDGDVHYFTMIMKN